MGGGKPADRNTFASDYSVRTPSQRLSLKLQSKQASRSTAITGSGRDDDIRERFPAVHGDELDRHHQRGDGEEDDPDAARYPWCESKKSVTERTCRAYTIRNLWKSSSRLLSAVLKAARRPSDAGREQGDSPAPMPSGPS